MPDLEWAFIFDASSCIQCQACEVACKSWRQVEPGLHWRKLLTVWQGTYPAVTCVGDAFSCQHCVDPACLAACPTAAISKRDEDGIVLVDADLCIGCQACADACPFRVPQFGADGKMQKCDLCLGQPGSPAPPCVRTCPTQALELRLLPPADKERREQALLSNGTD